MKITANAGELADALALAASLIDAKIKIPALSAVLIKATSDAVTVTANVLDFALTLIMPAVVEAAGELAVPGVTLAALTAGFPGDATISIASDSSIARVSCGRAYFRLPTVPIEDLPPPPALGKELGRAELAREELLTLLRIGFAASTEKTRYYMNGILLHDTDEGLVAAATDGHKFCRAIVPTAAGLSSDHKLIIPSPAVEIVGKILRGDKDAERVTLRRSRTLFELQTLRAAFASKLIDGSFPNYARFLPKPSSNTITVDRANLLQALARVGAMAGEHRLAVVGLSWGAEEAALRVCLADSDAANDVIVAESAGRGRVAARIRLLVELLDAFDGARVRMDSRRGAEPILITSPNDDPELLAVLTPCTWAAQASQAA
jgi:DNA polymerase-3 subunit beta